MQLRLDLPDYWPLRKLQSLRAGWLQAIVPGHQGSPDLWLEIGSLGPLPEDLRSWTDRAPFADRDPRQNWSVERVEPRQTALGWPALLTFLTVSRGTTGDEARCHVLYQFLEYGAEVCYVARNPDRLTQHQAALMTILLTATPDFAGAGSTHLAELWT